LVSGKDFENDCEEKPGTGKVTACAAYGASVFLCHIQFGSYDHGA